MARIKRSWLKTEYRKRRDVLYARTETCEWCKEPFDKSQRALQRTLHHLIERYETPDGEPDWAAYEAMRDEDVVIVHARCHRAWHKYRVRPPDPRLVCPTCGKWKPPVYAKCAPCALSEPGRKCACGNLKRPDEAECHECFSARMEAFSAQMEKEEAALYAASEARSVNPANESKTAKERLCQSCANPEEMRAKGLDPETEDLPGNDEGGT
jgi:hypothetical protein